jgi:hypothetical protein
MFLHIWTFRPFPFFLKGERRYSNKKIEWRTEWNKQKRIKEYRIKQVTKCMHCMKIHIFFPELDHWPYKWYHWCNSYLGSMALVWERCLSACMAGWWHHHRGFPYMVMKPIWNSPGNLSNQLNYKKSSCRFPHWVISACRLVDWLW